MLVSAQMSVAVLFSTMYKYLSCAFNFVVGSVSDLREMSAFLRLDCTVAVYRKLQVQFMTYDLYLTSHIYSCCAPINGSDQASMMKLEVSEKSARGLQLPTHHRNRFMALFRDHPGDPCQKRTSGPCGARKEQRQTHRQSGWAPLHPD